MKRINAGTAIIDGSDEMNGTWPEVACGTKSRESTGRTPGCTVNVGHEEVGHKIVDHKKKNYGKKSYGKESCGKESKLHGSRASGRKGEEVTEADDDDRLEILRARSHVYLLLAQTFFGNFEPLVEAAKPLAVVLEREEQDLLKLVRQLKVTSLFDLKLQYDNLFVAPGPHYVPPFEAHHRLESWEGYEQLSQFYTSVGFHFPFTQLERLDHIGCELAFMHFLIEGEIASLVNGEAKKSPQLHTLQHAFLAQHLSVWVDAFARQVGQKLTRGFMRDVAAYMRRFIARDYAQFL